MTQRTDPSYGYSLIYIFRNRHFDIFRFVLEYFWTLRWSLLVLPFYGSTLVYFLSVFKIGQRRILRPILWTLV